MNLILIVLLLIALFHLFIYYWNIDLVPKPVSEPTTDLSETKSILEKHLNELKQYNTITKNG
jgi:hypothetical protein